MHIQEVVLISYTGPPQQYSYSQQLPSRGKPQGHDIQSFISEPKAIGGLALGIIGGIMVMASIFSGFVSICQTSSTFGYTLTICMSVGPGGASYLGITASIGLEFSYGYLLLVFGLIMLLFTVLTPVFRRRDMATMIWVFGMLAIVMALILLLHFLLRSSASFGYFGGTAFSSSVLPGVGFFIAIVGGVLGIVGGILLARQVLRSPPAPYQGNTVAMYEARPFYPPPPPPSQPPQY